MFTLVCCQMFALAHCDRQGLFMVITGSYLTRSQCQHQAICCWGCAGQGLVLCISEYVQGYVEAV
jgi:hypothetical protein